MVYPSYQQLTPKKAQEFGQSYYRRRQYDLALEAFSTAIELSDNYPIDVLDNRAATYEKLGDLKSALGDARLMLQLEKSSAQVQSTSTSANLLLLTATRATCALAKSFSYWIGGVMLQVSTSVGYLECLQQTLSTRGLKHLDVRLDDQHFLDLAPCLRELTLFGWADLFTLFPADYSSLSQLESLTLIRCGIDRFPLLPPTIRQLRIATDLCLRMDTLASQANLAANDYSQLESLTLRDIYDLKLRDITSMLSYPSDCRNSPLKILRIGRCLGLTNADLIALLTSKATKQVVELCLVGGNKINDTLSEAISEMEDLEYLDLSENSKLTGVSVKKIASKSGKPLKLLRINQCSSIGIDAVEMARRTGVEVKFLITDWETGRVRFPTHFF
ncbi:hypothetical protein FGG08_002609 [Glutinoglossum americanum]|uniref:RNI-like protein n=1 Tax=Glutinoglossum americanum TaxID=1670608 RepID=A0A9P8I5W6_9PEZI|nr:hypothetical protein FGG08_002609 [Glutinoglossum americanum]